MQYFLYCDIIPKLLKKLKGKEGIKVFMIKRLYACVREYRLATWLTPLFILGEAVIECLIPYRIANLINNLNDYGVVLESIIKDGLILAALACASLICGTCAAITAAKAGSGFAKNLRHDMYDCIVKYSFANIDRFSSSSLVTRLTTDVGYVQMAFMIIIRMAIRCPLMLIFSIIMAYIMGGTLSTMFVIVVPVLAVGLFLVAKNAMPAFRSVFRKYDKLNESIEENVSAMRAVKSFVREDYEQEKFTRASEDIRKDFTHAERIVALNSPLMQLCLYFNMAFVLYVGSKLIIGSSGTYINVGQLSAMITYGFQILSSLMMVAMVCVMLTLSAESAHRIYEVLNEKSSLNNPENPVTEVKSGDIDFSGVSFKYSEKAEKNALDKIDLHIKSGQTVGILGGTGSGKSTLVQLIPRLYDVSEGSVKVGDVDVRDYDIETLRDQVAMVLQKNLLFAGTISENLRWGNENATDEELREACRLSQADEFISQFPDGYETHIEQGGSNVSGGQKQRLCIARALLKKPKILILDDSTSAVDMKTDALIRMGFKQYIPETTKIIIAQRVASVMEADLIVVMDGGGICDAGTHDELMARCDIYRDIYDQQTRGGGKDEE